MAYQVETFTVRPAGTTGGNKHFASDGTSIWVSNGQQGGAGKGYICRLRLSDGAYLDWNTGAVSTQAAATKADFTGTWPNDHHPGAMVAVGGVLWVCIQGANSRYVHGYTIATGVKDYEYNVYINGAGAIPGQYAYVSGIRGIAIGGDAYFPTLGGPWAAGTYACILKVNTSGCTLFELGDAYTTYADWLETTGSDLWMSTVRVVGPRSGIVQVSTDGTVLQFIDGTAAMNNPASLIYDGATYMWMGTNSYLSRFRVSDGYFVQPDGTAQVGWSSACSYPTPDGAASYTVCVEWDGTHIWSGGGGPKPWSMLPASGVWNVIVNCGANTPESYFDGTWVWFADATGALVYRVYAEVPLILPNLTAVAPGTGPRVTLTFDNPVGITGPTIGAASDGLGVTGVTAISATQIDLACTTTPPNLTQVTPNNAGFGVELTFDSDIAASSPILDPPLNGLEVTSATAPDTTHIQVDLQFPTLVSTTLVSIVASVGAITLTFNKAVALSLTGQQPSSYVITTVTPGAVIPTIASVEVVGNQVVLHTSEQTTGANYTVTIAPGSIYGTT